MTKKNEILLLDDRDLEEKVYIVRGVQVMLDFELAEIYGYTTSKLNEQVKKSHCESLGTFQFDSFGVPESLRLFWNTQNGIIFIR